MVRNRRFGAQYPGAARALAVLALLLATPVTAFFVLRGQPRAKAETLSPEPKAAPVRAAAGTNPARKVIAYYFHVTVRCVTCRTIESYSREAIEQGFGRELKDGTIEWRPVNVQQPENRHFIRDYQLFTRSLVLVRLRDGKQVEWRNLEKVWDLVGRRGEFLKYVQSNVKLYLGGG